VAEAGTEPELFAVIANDTDHKNTKINNAEIKDLKKFIN
jgi:hypothetical protein